MRGRRSSFISLISKLFLIMMFSTPQIIHNLQIDSSSTDIEINAVKTTVIWLFWSNP